MSGSRFWLVAFCLIVLVACTSGDADPESATTLSSAATAPSTTTAAPSTTSQATSSSTSGETRTIGPGQEVRITDVLSAVHCDGGGEVYVMSDNASVTISGSCADIEIRGSTGTIGIAISSEVEIHGSENLVAIDEVGEIDVYGNGNTVILGSVGEIDVEGNNNSIAWESGNPSIDDEGSGNTISQA